MKHKIGCVCGGAVTRCEALGIVVYRCDKCGAHYGLGATALICQRSGTGKDAAKCGNVCLDRFEEPKPVRACPRCGMFRVFGYSSYDSGSPPAQYCHNCGHKYQ